MSTICPGSLGNGNAERSATFGTGDLDEECSENGTNVIGCELFGIINIFSGAGGGFLIPIY